MTDLSAAETPAVAIVVSLLPPSKMGFKRSGQSRRDRRVPLAAEQDELEAEWTECDWVVLRRDDLVHLKGSLPWREGLGVVTRRRCGGGGGHDGRVRV
jgi:hypothetical protein